MLKGIMAVAVIAFASSCSDDKSNIGGGGSVPVADGFYVTKVGVTPTAADQLKDEVVEDDAFATQAREGFLANYVYLTAGTYNVVSVIDQEISKTFGGTSAVAGTPAAGSSGASECNLNEYILVEEFAENGAAVTIDTEGLYKVGFDNTLKEIWFLRIQKAHIIGGATSFDWSQNADGEMSIEGTPSAAGVTFKKTNILLTNGEWKVRFDCRWSVDRRIDPAAGFDATNGYVAFTNFGGTTTLLAPGGKNLIIPFGSDGKYTVQLAWTPATGFVLTTTNTEPIAPKAVNSYAWSIIGSARVNPPSGTGWDDPDTDLPLKPGSTTSNAIYEIASIALSEGGEFKFRAEDSWGIVIKPGASILGTVTGDTNFESTGGDDPNWKVKVGGAGNYKITIATTNTGQNWTLTFVKL